MLPLVKGGLAATAVLCFIFSWTEFLLSLLLTTSIRTVPVKISTFVTSTGHRMGLHHGARHGGDRCRASSSSCSSRRHLVRGLTLGSLKE